MNCEEMFFVILFSETVRPPLYEITVRASNISSDS